MENQKMHPLAILTCVLGLVLVLAGIAMGVMSGVLAGHDAAGGGCFAFLGAMLFMVVGVGSGVLMPMFAVMIDLICGAVLLFSQGLPHADNFAFGAFMAVCLGGSLLTSALMSEFN